MQIFGVIFAIFVAIIVFAVAVWLIQWGVACLVWCYQVALMPFFVYFFPAILLTTVVIGIYLGSYISASNYFISVKKHVNPEGDLKKVLKFYIISILMLILSFIYIAFTIISCLLIYDLLFMFVNHILEYYDTIIFPAFEIHFPFWEK